MRKFGVVRYSDKREVLRTLVSEQSAKVELNQIKQSAKVRKDESFYCVEELNEDNSFAPFGR